MGKGFTSHDGYRVVIIRLGVSGYRIGYHLDPTTERSICLEYTILHICTRVRTCLGMGHKLYVAVLMNRKNSCNQSVYL